MIYVLYALAKSQIVIQINDAELREGLSTRPPKITQIWNEEMKTKASTVSASINH